MFLTFLPLIFDEFNKMVEMFQKGFRGGEHKMERLKICLKIHKQINILREHESFQLMILFLLISTQHKYLTNIKHRNLS